MPAAHEPEPAPSATVADESARYAERVRYERTGHVAVITYDREDKLNAIDGAMRDGLNTAFERFRADDEAWVGIVTGAGRAFSAGADFASERNPAGEFAGSFWERPTVNSFESGWEIHKPVIAAVNGICLGYALTLVTWCDLVLASDRATFGYPEVKLGVPTIVGALRLPQRIGWQPAMELLLTGETVSAQRAKEMGLVVQVVAHDELLDAAHALADRLLQGAPLAQRAIKEVARRAPHLPEADAIRFGETMRRVAGATADAAEGAAAAREKRPPRWEGR
jgi:E-phenylitaconyl-CoA hydratase